VWQRTAWIEEYRKELRRERARIESTVRYQLGNAVIDCVRRPWRVFSLLETVVRLARRGAAQQSPLLHPPLPATPFEETGVHPPLPATPFEETGVADVETSREVHDLAREVSAIERGFPF
jgi:hypothetical protein